MRMTLLLAALCAPAIAVAQEPDLITDRPDQTESAVTVPRGSVQIEIGVGVGRDDEGADVETLALGSTLVRIGWTDRLELRVGWDGYLDESVDLPGGGSSSVSGVGDGELGFKWLLAEESGERPQVALLAATTVPLGDDRLTSDELDPSFRLAVSRALTDSVDLGVNAGVSWESVPRDAGGTRRESSAIYTVAAGFPAGGWGGIFVELFGEVPLSSSGGSAHSFDGGITYLVRPNLQLDLAGGIGLSEAAEDWFLGVGLSVRLPR